MARRSLHQQEPPNWDPMSADYYDSTFNSYSHGPGSRLDRQLQPCHSRLERENVFFKLHVRNIPAKLDETGIRNLFLHFGDPLDIYRHPPGFGAGWAFVTYASHREAELAIRELNDTPPFYFKVQFARSPAEKERIRKERENDEILRTVLDSEPYPVHSGRAPFGAFNRGIGRGRGIPLPRLMMVSGRRPGKYEQLVFCDDEILDEASADEEMNYFRPYVPGIYDETNRMIMQQGVNLTVNSSSGKRWVSMGRGYYPASERPVGREYDTKTYIKEEKHILIQKLEEMYEQEHNGWYECGDKVNMRVISGNCLCCEKVTDHHCKQCGGFYCSRECQVKDWPQHKTDCILIPPLTSASKSPGFQRNYSSEQFSDVRQRHDNKLRNSDVCHGSQQNRCSSSDGVEYSDTRKKSHFDREGQNRANTKENDRDGQNRNTGLDRNRNEHFNTQFDDSKKMKFRSGNSFNESRNQNNSNEDEASHINTDATEMKRSSVNERLRVGRQVENNGNPFMASIKTSPRVQKESEGVYPRNTLPAQKTNEALAESTPKTAIGSTDSPVAKTFGAVKKVKTPDAEGSIVVNKMKTLSLKDSITTTTTTSSCIKSEELPKDKFTKVKITVTVGPMEYWVQLADSEENLLHVMGVLFNAPELSSCELQVGALCAALYEDLWYRGRVTSIEPELKVIYIDYGNEEVCTPDKLKAMPSSIVDTPALALRIKLAEGTSGKYNMLAANEVLSVKPVGKTADGTVVHVEGEMYEAAAAEESAPKTSTYSTPLEKTPPNYPLPRPKQKSQAVPIKGLAESCAVEGLKVGTQGGGQFRQHLIGDDCTITIVYSQLKEQFTKLFGDLHEACESAPVDGNYKPNVGDMVGAFAKVGSAQENDTWNRAYILSVTNSGYHVNFCDVGCIGTVKTVKKLPQDLASIPEFAVRCSVINYTIPKDKVWSPENSKFFFTVTDIDESRKTATCVLRTASEELCKATLKRWVPAVEDEGLRSIQLKNNDFVVLQVFFDQKSLYLRNASSSSKDVFCQLNQDVGVHCIRASELDHMPAKNELLACKFERDGNYYRAQVLEVENLTVKVTYVDFGNLGCVSKDKLRPLPDSLKRIPCMVTKVSLKDAVDKPLTAETSDFLSNLVYAEVEMKLICSGSFKDGVQLILPDGDSLNDKVNTMLEPGWKKAIAAGKNPTECKIFMEEDIKYVELPVGNTIDFLVLHKMDGVTFMGCEADGQVMKYVHTTVTEEINSYCNSTPEKSYVPRYSELCFARFEDDVWYRAMYLQDSSSKESNVIFLDFGNMAHIDKTNIRKMVPDYVNTPAVAVLCSLEGLENPTETQKKRVDELVQVNKIYKARVVSFFGSGNYLIEFPHVIEVLGKENLLPSGN